MARVEYTLSAIEDLDAILDYTTTNWGPKQAKLYLNGLEKQAQRLADMPTLGQFYDSRKYPDLRVFPFQEHRICYLEKDFGIIILHLNHKNMDQHRHISPNFHKT